MVSKCHHGVRDKAGTFAELVVPKSEVLYEPYIFHGAGTRVGGAAASAEFNSKVGDKLLGGVMVHDL